MKNNFTAFTILFSVFISIGLLSKELLGTDDLMINSLAEQLTQEQLEETIGLKEKWQWLAYFLLPLLMLLKISVIAAIIDVGCFFFDKEIKYKKLFNIVLKAEFVFILVVVFKTIWFYVFQQDYTFEDLQYFYPLSILNIVDYNDLKPWFIYPLQVINVFEIMYWGILASLLSKALYEKTSKAISIVVSSYGVGLLIWVVAVMFFTLNMS